MGTWVGISFERNDVLVDCYYLDPCPTQNVLSMEFTLSLGLIWSWTPPLAHVPAVVANDVKVTKSGACATAIASPGASLPQNIQKPDF